MVQLLLMLRTQKLRIDIAAPNPQSPSMVMALENYIREVNKRKSLMRFTFKKEERLYGHAGLENVYKNGKQVSTDSIKIIYLEVPKSGYPCRVVFSVSLERALKEARAQEFN